MTFHAEIQGMGLFTAFLKAAWAIITAAVAAWFIILGWNTPDPEGTIWAGIGVFIIGLVFITIWASTICRNMVWP